MMKNKIFITNRQRLREKQKERERERTSRRVTGKREVDVVKTTKASKEKQ